MTAELSLRDLTGRASFRAVPAKRWARLIAGRAAQEGLDNDSSSRDIAAGLLHQILQPGSPALLLGYLAQGLATHIFSARTFTLELLSHLHRSELPVSTPVLSSICVTLLGDLSELGASDLLPSFVVVPPEAPDIGTSSSAAAEEVPTLTLILPLLRQCTQAPAPAPLLGLATRLTSLIPALPAPPFAVGLEAAQLSAVLPEDLAKPLRESLAGLMEELPLPAAVPNTDADVDMFGGGLGDVGLSQFGDLGVNILPPMAPIRGPSPLSLQQGVGLLLEYSHRAHGWTRNSAYAAEPPQPPAHHIQIIRLGRTLTSDPQEFLAALLEASLGRILTSWARSPSLAAQPLFFFTDGLPVVLRWWRENADPKWPFPIDFQGALANLFAVHSTELADWFQAVNSIYTTRFTQSETEDDSGAYSQPDGWLMLSLEAAAARRYTAIGLIDEDATIELTGNLVKAGPPGESLLDRLTNVTQAHLPALEFFITHAAGSPHTLGSELVQCITNAAQTQPPDELFTRLAASPSLIALITTYITPSSLLDLLVAHLLDRVEDESARLEDPQRSLVRFGSGVVLVEALCAQFDLPLPNLLYNSRRVSSLADLTDKEISHLNGWAKALFGSDGIDDEIILTTSAQGLCLLTPTLVQQSIIAAMSGQIDLDTLHSGLSYFAQPLLSWCLGGVVGWLCGEIERQGILSGLHLNVLQTLVLDSAFPEPLLRANTCAINRLLEPNTGLEAVLQSSNFDVAGVRARIEAVGGPDGSVIVPDLDPVLPLPNLRSELQSVRHLELAAPGWEARVLDALGCALRVQGTLRTLEVTTEVLYPPIMDSPAGDPLGQLIALLCALHFPRLNPVPLAFALIDGYVPTLFGSRSPFIPAAPQPPTSTAALLTGTGNPAVQPPPPLPFAAQALHSLIRATLLDLDATGGDNDTALADTLASHLADELAYQRERPQGGIKRVARGAGPGALPDTGLTAGQRELLDELGTLLEGDDELRARWPALIAT